MRLIELLLAQRLLSNQGFISPLNNVPCLSHPSTQASLLCAMETSVSLPPIEEDLTHTFEFVCDEALEECMNQPITNRDCFFGTSSGTGVAFSDAGTTLAEMLQTESILLQGSRTRTESSSSASSVLTHLLQSDQNPSQTSSSAPQWNNNVIDSFIKKELMPESECLKTSPTLTHILQSDQVTSSTEMTAALAAKSKHEQTLSPDSSTQNENLTLTEILKKSSPQKKLQAASGTTQKSGDNSNLTLHQALTRSSPLVLNKNTQELSDQRLSDSTSNAASLMHNSTDEDGSSSLPTGNMDCFPLLSLDDEASLFENGIAASDVGSLLSQFEEAAVNLMDEPAAQATTVTMTTVTPESRPSSQPVVTSQRSQPGSVSHSNNVPVLTDPHSEVLKLLKTKSPLLPKAPRASSNTPQPVPPPEVIEKIKASAKRKSAIMLSTCPPTKNPALKRSQSSTTIQHKKHSASDNTTKPSESRHKTYIPRNESPPPMPLALQSSSRSSSPLRVSLPEIDLGNFTPAPSPASSCDISQPATPSNKPVKRISITQYKHRIRSCQSSRSSSPIPGSSSSSSSSSSVPTEVTVSQAAALLNFQLNHDEENQVKIQQPSPVSHDYYDLIADHDYCQNVPAKVADDEDEDVQNQAGSGETLKEEVVWDGELAIMDAEVTVAATDTKQDSSNVSCEVATAEWDSLHSGMEVADEDKNSNTVLKSLLLNTNLEEECKEQAVKDRVMSQQNMSLPQQPQICGQEAPGLMTLCNTSKSSHVETVSTDDQSSANDKWPVRSRGRGRESERHRRNYRKHEKSASGGSEPTFDKLPTYYTALATPLQPGLPRNESTSSLIQRQCSVVPDRDRDPSPDRSDPMFNKMPAYFSCFTNSTKYDEGKSCGLDIAHSDGDWDAIPSSQSPYDAHSPDLHSGLCERSTSPHSSLSPVRRKPNDAYSKTRSRSRYRRSRRSRQRSYSSSSSCSTCSSSSSSESPDRYSSRRSRHRYRSRSPVRSYGSRSRYSRSRSPDRYHRKSRHGRRSSRSRSRSRHRALDTRRDREKQIQIEERRIVYVGRIPSDFTRRDLREKFGCFGDITDVSVHFREHGDNYGFVTYRRTKDAYSCVERGCSVAGCESFDMCFGGRREFCKTEYADLDGNMEMEEELAPMSHHRGGMAGRSSDPLDFDSLLKSTMQSLKKKKH